MPEGSNGTVGSCCVKALIRDVVCTMVKLCVDCPIIGVGWVVNPFS